MEKGQMVGFYYGKAGHEGYRTVEVLYVDDARIQGIDLEKYEDEGDSGYRTFIRSYISDERVIVREDEYIISNEEGWTPDQIQSVLDELNHLNDGAYIRYDEEADIFIIGLEKKLGEIELYHANGVTSIDFINDKEEIICWDVEDGQILYPENVEETLSEICQHFGGSFVKKESDE